MFYYFGETETCYLSTSLIMNLPTCCWFCCTHWGLKEYFWLRVTNLIFNRLSQTHSFYWQLIQNGAQYNNKINKGMRGLMIINLTRQSSVCVCVFGCACTGLSKLAKLFLAIFFVYEGKVLRRHRCDCWDRSDVRNAIICRKQCFCCKKGWKRDYGVLQEATKRKNKERKTRHDINILFKTWE